jgi:hypothetical protein
MLKRAMQNGTELSEDRDEDEDGRGVYKVSLNIALDISERGVLVALLKQLRTNEGHEFWSTVVTQQACS